jgi:phage terminase large subunit-like protein
VKLLASIAAYQADPLQRYATEPAGWSGMSGVQREFHQSTARKRFALWANSMGKTYCGAAEAWFHLLAEHPYREVRPGPVVGWMLADDLQQGWLTACKAMRMLEPPSVVDPSCNYDEIRGYTWRNRRVLRLLNGSMMVGKGGSQSAMSMEGDKIDFLWVDEIPRRSHWNGCVSRVNRTFGAIWVTMTAITRASYLDTTWLRNKVDGNPETKDPPEEGRHGADDDGWDFLQRGMSRDRVLHLSDEQYSALVNDVDPWERAQRVDARWEGVTAGRWVPAFSVDNVFDTIEFEWTDIAQIGLGADYGERPGNTIWFLAFYTHSDRVYIVAEWSPAERMTEAEEAAGVVEHLLTPLDLKPADVDVARGDSNSSGHRGIALSINELLMQHFARMMPNGRAPFDLRPPYKGPGSIRHRARMINTACAESRFHVHESCSRLLRTLRNWMGLNDDLKHAFDGAGYISEVWLAPGAARGGHHMIIKR